MRQFLFNLAQRVCRSQFEYFKERTLVDHMAVRDANVAAMKLAVMNELVGKPVICLSNEYDNPLVGFVEEVQLITKSESPVYIVWDCIGYQRLMVLGQTFKYSHGLLEMVFTADRMRLNELIYRDDPKRVYKMPGVPLLKLSEAKTILQQRGFFNTVAKVWESERTMEGVSPGPRYGQMESGRIWQAEKPI